MPATETRGTDGEIWRRLLEPENVSLSPVEVVEAGDTDTH
jgi:hypothetical protein